MEFYQFRLVVKIRTYAENKELALEQTKIKMAKKLNMPMELLDIIYDPARK